MTCAAFPVAEIRIQCITKQTNSASRYRWWNVTESTWPMGDWRGAGDTGTDRALLGQADHCPGQANCVWLKEFVQIWVPISPNVFHHVSGLPTPNHYQCRRNSYLIQTNRFVVFEQTVSSHFRSTNQKLKKLPMAFRLFSIPKKSFSRLQTKLRIRLWFTSSHD